MSNLKNEELLSWEVKIIQCLPGTKTFMAEIILLILPLGDTMADIAQSLSLLVLCRHSSFLFHIRLLLSAEDMATLQKLLP